MDRSLYFFDRRSSSPRPIYSVHDAGDAILDISCSHTANSICSVSADGILRQYDFRSSLLRASHAFPKPLSHVRHTSDSGALFLSCLNQSIYLVDSGSCQRLAAYSGHSHGELSFPMACSTDDAHLLTYSLDGFLCVYDVLSESCFQKIPFAKTDRIWSISYDPRQLCNPVLSTASGFLHFLSFSPSS